MRNFRSPLALLFALVCVLPAQAQDRRGSEREGERGRGGEPREQAEPLRRAQPQPPAREERPRSDRDRDQDKPKTREPRETPPAPPAPPRAPSQLPPATPLLPPSFGASPNWLVEDFLVLDCRDARVCLLSPLDEYVAWMLAGQTTLPWRHLVDAKIDQRSWMEVLAYLDIALWELYAAFDLEMESASQDFPPTDAAVRGLAERHLNRIQPPTFHCRLPLELEGVSAYQLDLQNGTSRALIDGIDDEIAARISDETGWCVDDLIAARKFLGDWPRTARELSISPFLFEVSFGIQLDVLDLRTRVVRYPTEEQIRYVARRELWPELRAGR